MSITINAATNVELTVPLQTTVALDTTVTGSQYLWTMAGRPTGSVAVLSSTSIQNPTFLADLPGSYLLTFTVDNIAQVVGLVGVKHPRAQSRIPSPGEGSASLGGGSLASPTGWATTREQHIRFLDGVTARGSMELAINDEGSNIVFGQAVYVSGHTILHPATTVEVPFPQVKLADASALDTAVSVGVCLGKVDLTAIYGTSSPAANGEVLAVLWHGLLQGVDTSTYVRGDQLYVSGTPGNFTNAPVLFYAPLGVVVESDPAGSIMVYGGPTSFRERRNWKRLTGVVAPGKLEMAGSWFNFDTLGGAGTLNLPTGDASLDGVTFCVSRAGTNAVTINCSGGDAFLPGGSPSETISVDEDSLEFTYDAVGFHWVRMNNPISVNGATSFVVTSQATAEAGLDNTEGMTPLRTAQAVAFQRAFATNGEAATGVLTDKVISPSSLKHVVDTIVLVIASQPEAEAGTDNAKTMTSLRVKQAMDARVTPDTPPYFVARTRSDTDVDATYNNGAGTLTANNNGALVIDGATMDDGELLFVNGQLNTFEDGLYDVTDKGSAGTPFVLTRNPRFDEDVEIINHTLVKVVEGDRFQSGLYLITTAFPFSLGTDAIIVSEATFRARKSFLTKSNIATLSVAEVDNKVVNWFPSATGTDTLTLPEGDSSLEGVEVSVVKETVNAGTLEVQGADVFFPGGLTSKILSDDDTLTFTYDSTALVWRQIGYVPAV